MQSPTDTSTTTPAPPPALPRTHTTHGSLAQPLAPVDVSSAQERVLAGDGGAHATDHDGTGHDADIAAVSWKQMGQGSAVYVRPCFGQEDSASYNQNVRDGHTELSMCLPFEWRSGGARGSSDNAAAADAAAAAAAAADLVERARAAWRAVRYIHPEAAVEMTTGRERPQTMTFVDYRQPGYAAQEQAWLDETFEVVQADADRGWWEVAEETYRRKLPTQGKRSKMYLVLAASDGTPPRHRRSVGHSDSDADADSDADSDIEYDSHAFIWNVSHAVTDGFSFNVFYNSFLQLLVDGPQRAALASSSSSSASDILARLPDSVLPAYVRSYAPSAADRAASIAQAQAQLRLYEEKMPLSLALRPHHAHTSAARPHRTTCLLARLSPAQSASVLASLRAHADRLTVTYLGAAATLLAIRARYARGGEQGALLGITRNARRWVRTEPAVGHAADADAEGAQRAIPMATDVVYLWIPFDGLGLPDVEADVEAPAETDTEAQPTEPEAQPKETETDTQARAQARADGITQQHLVCLARRIQAALAPHLRSPHYMAAIGFMSARFVDGLAQADAEGEGGGEGAGSDVHPVGPQAPGFSPGGAWAIRREFTPSGGSDSASASRSSGTSAGAAAAAAASSSASGPGSGSGSVPSPSPTLLRHALYQTGRQINPSPWVSLFSVDARLNLQLGYDEKYWEGAEMRGLLGDVRALILRGGGVRAGATGTAGGD